MAPSAAEVQKPGIPAAFDRVAARYDRMCALNPGYRAHLRRSAERLGLASGARVLDLCCGTGLSTEALLDAIPGARVVGLDASAGMLGHARAKRRLAAVELVQGDAMDPRATGLAGRFDGILMAYGLRNVPDPDLCLARLRELLVPGGTLCLHEYSVADSARSRLVWNAVSLGIVVPLALVVTGSTAIFRYLRRSVLEFDGVRALEARLAREGFVEVETLPMDGWQRGIVHTFRARAPR
jgi:ubiquinone/menaquinone biosynthesis C-methylase UbiE